MEADSNWNEFRHKTQTVTHPQLAAAAAQTIHRSPEFPSTYSYQKGADRAKAPSQSRFPSHSPGAAWAAGQGDAEGTATAAVPAHINFLGK